jgi:predicted RNase H-like HicB family nuclease
MDYIAIIHKDPDSAYGVSFPDFPGCVSAGATLDEAKSMAAEALALALEEMHEDGEPPPQPSSLDKVMRNPDFRDGVAFLVSAGVSDRTVRVNITVTARDLREIDAKARAQGLSRSAFLVRSALAEQGAG